MIVWDLGGVGARFEPAVRLQAIGDAARLAPQQVDGAIWGSGLDTAAERRVVVEVCWPKTPRR